MTMDLSAVSFGVGAHPPTDAPTGDRDLCIMEAVSYMAGEPWSDSPSCASPVVSAFLRVWNDALYDEDRDRLLPAAVWVPRLIGSRGDEAAEQQRAYLALDWLVRMYLPAWLDLVPSLAMHAATLRAMPEIVDLATAEHSNDAALVAAETAVWAVARAAAGEAAGDVASDAVWAVAREAAGEAAGEAAWEAVSAVVREVAGAVAGDVARTAARSIARAVARAVARDAVRDVAQNAAQDTLAPTVKALQHSALALLDRMLACGEHRREKQE